MNQLMDNLLTKGLPAVTGALSGAVVLFIGIAANEQKIQFVDDKYDSRMSGLEHRVDRFEAKQILPEASARLAATEARNADLERRVTILETFKTQGARCTFNDCKRIEQRLDRVADAQTACLTSLSTLIYRLDRAEMEIDNFGDKD